MPALNWDGQAGETPAAIRASHRPQVANAALKAIRNARTHEAIMTAQLLASIESQPAALAGLEYRIKAPSSLARKIRDVAVEKMLTPNEAAERIEDIVRYPVTTAKISDLVPTLSAVVDFLSASGWIVSSAQQSFVMGNPYKGIHVVFVGPSGHKCEIQFHTESALATKEFSHQDYKIYRDTELPRQSRRRAYEASADAWASIQTPPGLRRLATLGGVAVIEKSYPFR